MPVEHALKPEQSITQMPSRQSPIPAQALAQLWPASAIGASETVASDSTSALVPPSVVGSGSPDAVSGAVRASLAASEKARVDPVLSAHAPIASKAEQAISVLARLGSRCRAPTSGQAGGMSAAESKRHAIRQRRNYRHKPIFSSAAPANEPIRR